ncbi:hypothetical protein ACFQ4O_01740 [Methylopila musalis]|uniref:Uncharacterized protein n=1 Tax=Methylopila musalis TaxID=1134781 RepID=A0ABW3Z4D1_9HYPH
MRADLADMAVASAFDALGAAATYRAPGAADALPCRVILKSGDQEIEPGAARLNVGSGMLDVRLSEVARPVRGGLFTLGADIWRVMGDPRREDPLRRVWTCPVQPAGA